MRECFTCKKQTKNPKFCSRGCYQYIAFEKHNKRPLKEYFCAGCTCSTGFGFNNNRGKYCEICRIDEKINKNYRDWSKITLEDMKHKYNDKYRFHARIRALARVNKNITPCNVCGYEIHVEVCHIKPISKFEKTTLISEINHESNLVCLCPNCHWEFDHGLVQLKS